MEKYQEIDLNDKPCLFLDCGHFFSVETLDGMMSMGQYYDTDKNGHPTDINGPSKPFSVDAVKVCPECRGSLRNINRYGRIVRRAFLDEATKKFISWSNSEFSKIGMLFVEEHQRLESEKDDKVVLDCNSSNLRLNGLRDHQMRLIWKSPAKAYLRRLLQIRERLRIHLDEVKREQQPFQRVADLVHYAKRQDGLIGHFAMDESVIQLRGFIQSFSLLLRCDLYILTRLADLSNASVGARFGVDFHLDSFQRDALYLVKMGVESSRPYEQVEGHIYCAQSHALMRLAQREDDSTGTKGFARVAEELRTAGEGCLTLAENLVHDNPSTASLSDEIESTRVMLRGGTFYSSVSLEEKRAIYEAMATEFSGTGHWYVCPRGHHFTIGECGMAMQERPCAECGILVGGRNHQNAAGVTRAQDMDQLARDVQGLHN